MTHRRLSLLLWLGTLLLVGCGPRAPVSDAHDALMQTVGPIRAWRVEQGHVGQSVELPVLENVDEQVRRALAEQVPGGVTFPQVLDGKAGKLKTAYKIKGKVPSTFVLDREGRVRFYFDNSAGDAAALERAVQGLLSER